MAWLQKLDDLEREITVIVGYYVVASETDRENMVAALMKKIDENLAPLADPDTLLGLSILTRGGKSSK